MFSSSYLSSVQVSEESFDAINKFSRKSKALWEEALQAVTNLVRK